MMGPGLALEQAPPFSVPLRFFLTAPLFLMAAGMAAAWQPAWTTAPGVPATLALTHLLTLGYLSMVMLGALTQLLPVVAGVPLPVVRRVSAFSHAGLTLGTPMLCWGLYDGEPIALLAGGVLLGLGIGVFLAAALISLAKGRSLDTLRAMVVALASLAVVLAIGIILIGWLSGLWQPDEPERWLSRHVAAGLGGWIGMLVMGTAWQVVPMLQITPPYPSHLTRGLLVTGAASLIASLTLPSPGRVAGDIGLSLVAVVFAVATLELQRRRKRKVADAALSFWRLGMVALIAAAALLPFAEAPASRQLAGLLFLAGFALSVVNGMLYKIVPFLAWFHLQAQKGIMASGLPSMKDYLPDRLANGQLAIHTAALACLLAAPFLPVLAVPGGLLLAVSSAWLAWNLLRVIRLFRHLGGVA